MSREDILYLLNHRSPKDLIKAYCLEMGKPEHLVNLFITALVTDSHINNSNNFDYCYEYVLVYYSNKFDIILLSDQYNKFIKAF